MNANELADWILDEVRHADEAEEIATMLRQQQAEIKTLEGALAQLKHMNKNWQISENILLLELEKLQSRELTDEEIMDYVDAFSIDMGNVYEFQPDNVLQMIRAILDKAQEK